MNQWEPTENHSGNQLQTVDFLCGNRREPDISHACMGGRLPLPHPYTDVGEPVFWMCPVVPACSLECAARPGIQRMVILEVLAMAAGVPA